MTLSSRYRVRRDSVALLRRKPWCCGHVGDVERGALVAEQTETGRDPLGGVDRVAREAEASITLRTGSTEVEVAVVVGDGGVGRCTW